MANSLDAIDERLRILCEDQLPSMKEDITRRLDHINGSVGRHEQHINDLRTNQEIQKAQISVLKFLGGIVATFLGLLMAFLKFFFR